MMKLSYLFVAPVIISVCESVCVLLFLFRTLLSLSRLYSVHILLFGVKFSRVSVILNVRIKCIVAMLFVSDK